MQLASSGLRALKGRQAHFVLHSGQPQRSIHIPAFARPPPSQPTAHVSQIVFRHAKTAVSRFFAHLTAPSTLRSPVQLVPGTRTFHTPTRFPTIQERLSFPARHVLSRPISGPFLPRPPNVPRNISQVGLGVARNFSTTRPIFQHLVENVPVYARAFSEVDWEVRIQQERERLRMEKCKSKRAAKETKKTKAQAPLRPIQPIAAAAVPTASTVESKNAELDHYFPQVAMPEVTTYLLIPLAPTSTTRVPLPLHPPVTLTSAHPLLPLDVIGPLHASHGTHALRVSTLFARLDVAQVFDNPGVHFEAHGDASGLCTVLEVRFEGWSESQVRGVLGEAGIGWCVVEEVRHDQQQAETKEMDEALDALSVCESVSTHDGPASGTDSNGRWASFSEGSIDPARSFVLPTLDFSASFPQSSWSSNTNEATAAAVHSPTPLSDLEFHNVWSQGASRSSPPGGWWSDEEFEVGSASGSDWDEVSRSGSSADRPFIFSSRFSERLERSDGSRVTVCD